MSESFNLSFSKSELDLYSHLKKMKNASGWIKGCIKAHMNGVEPEIRNGGDIDSQVKSIFDRIYGDIFDDYGGEYQFIRVQEECQSDIRETMKNRTNQVKRVCNGDMFLHDSVMDYAREHLPKLGRYL